MYRQQTAAEHCSCGVVSPLILVSLPCLRAGRLVEVGVTHAFGVPGDFNLTLLDQLLANKGLNMVWYAPTCTPH